MSGWVGGWVGYLPSQCRSLSRWLVISKEVGRFLLAGRWRSWSMRAKTSA